MGSSQEEVSGGGVAGATGAGWLCAQQPRGSWNSRKTGPGVVSGWHTDSNQHLCCFLQQSNYKVMRGTNLQNAYAKKDKGILPLNYLYF